MATFQTSVNLYPASAVQGDLLNDQVVYTPFNARAGENGVIVGAFVWNSETNGVWTGASTGTGVPTGIVQRVQKNPNFTIDSGNSMTVVQGYEYPTIVKGNVAVAVSDSATVGNVLFVNNTTGAITNAASGSNVAGATETTFKIISLLNNTSAAGQVVAVSNWS